MNGLVNQALRNNGAAERIKAMGAEPRPISVADFARQKYEDSRRHAQIVK